MISLVVPWVVFPVVLAILALGCGLAVERVTRTRLPGSLLIPAGLVIVLLIATLATATGATAGLAAPLVVVLAATGLAVSPPWEQRERYDAWGLGAAAGVFAVFGAPVVLSGHATFAGYIKLDDTASLVAVVDHIMFHGRSVTGLAHSSHQVVLDFYLNHGYPIGSIAPLAVGARILSHEALWLFQPWLAFLAASLCLTLNALLAGVASSARLRALCAFAAAQPALLFGYAMWGGVKELATAWIVALTAALVPTAIRAQAIGGPIWLALAAAAALSIFSFGGAVWVAPALIFAVVAIGRAYRGRMSLRLTASLAGVGGLLALPSLVLAHSFFTEFAKMGATNLIKHSAVANLPHPLSVMQLFGVWPAGDFRAPLPGGAELKLLILLVPVAAIVGIVLAVRQRAWALVIYGGATAALTLILVAVSSPWIAGKALAIGTPAVAVLAAAGVAAAWTAGQRVAAGIVGIAVVSGVLWSNARAYHTVPLAPRDQLEELQHIGRLAAGRGPTLMTDYNPYGSQLFLGPADGEGVSERLRWRLTPTRAGTPVTPTFSADTDDLQLDALLVYRTLVLRRSPVASRPPALYRQIWRGRTYEVWQRPAKFGALNYHLSLGGPVSPSGLAPCDLVRRVASLAGPRGRLATVQRSFPAGLALGQLKLPAGWVKGSTNPSIVFPMTKGRLTGSFPVPKSGRFDVWLGGSSHGRVTVFIDGRRVGALQGVINNQGAYLDIGRTTLRAGTHRMTISYDDGGLRPGSGGQHDTPRLMGPLLLTPSRESRTVRYVPAARWSALCGKPLDWVEAVPQT